MIRHKKSRIYRVKDSTCTVSEFRKSLSVSLNEVTEYSRPTKHASDFSKLLSKPVYLLLGATGSRWNSY